jgi:hypothetical protein
MSIASLEELKRQYYKSTDHPPAIFYSLDGWISKPFTIPEHTKTSATPAFHPVYSFIGSTEYHEDLSAMQILPRVSARKNIHRESLSDHWQGKF